MKTLNVALLAVASLVATGVSVGMFSPTASACDAYRAAPTYSHTYVTPTYYRPATYYAPSYQPAVQVQTVQSTITVQKQVRVTPPPPTVGAINAGAINAGAINSSVDIQVPVTGAALPVAPQPSTSVPVLAPQFGG